MQTTLINAPIVGEFSSIKKDELTYMKQYNKETIVHNIFCIIILERRWNYVEIWTFKS